MTSPMRAKLRVGSVIPHKDAEGKTISERVVFHGVAKNDGPYPADGSDENNTYAKFSPSALFDIQIANPALLGKYEPGNTFYVDFTPAD